MPACRLELRRAHREGPRCELPPSSGPVRCAFSDGVTALQLVKAGARLEARVDDHEGEADRHTQLRRPRPTLEVVSICQRNRSERIEPRSPCVRVAGQRLRVVEMGSETKPGDLAAVDATQVHSRAAENPIETANGGGPCKDAEVPRHFQHEQPLPLATHRGLRLDGRPPGSLVTRPHQATARRFERHEMRQTCGVDQERRFEDTRADRRLGFAAYGGRSGQNRLNVAGFDDRDGEPIDTDRPVSGPLCAGRERPSK